MVVHQRGGLVLGFGECNSKSSNSLIKSKSFIVEKGSEDSELSSFHKVSQWQDKKQMNKN